MKKENIRKQFDYDQPRKIHKICYNIYNDKPINENELLRFSTFHPQTKINPKKTLIGKLLKKTEEITLTKKTADLGLLLLNCFPKLRESSHWGYKDVVYSTSKRFKFLQENYDLDNLWNKEHYNLLILCFGEPMAKIIKKAYGKVGKLMYQHGYNRRSFRRPNDSTTQQVLQVNFIISLLNYETTHPFMLQEFIQHNITNYYSKVDLLIASEIDEGNAEILNICTDILQGKAEVGEVSRVIIKSLLLSNKPKAWELVGSLLLSAQRQEGLRQTILEALDETSIGAFQYILKLVNEHNLSRFSSVVRSMDVWAGFGWDAEKQSTIKRFFQLAETYVSQPKLLKTAIKSKDNAEVYMALWGQGVHNIEECYPYLKDLLKNGTLEKKSLVFYFVNQANINEWNKEFASLALSEKKPEFNYWAVKLFRKSVHLEKKEGLYEQILAIYKNFSKKDVKFTGKVFSWNTFTFTKEQVADLLITLTNTKEEAELNRLLENYAAFPIQARERIAEIILHNFNRWNTEKTLQKPTKKQRDFAFNVITDRSSLVRGRAMKTLESAEITTEELSLFEDFLTRKSSEFRQFVLEVIQKRNEIEILESAKRLVGKTNVEQRLAGLDLLNVLHKKEVFKPEIKTIITTFAERSKIGKKEQILLDNLLQEEVVEYNAENGYGLYNPNNKTEVKVLKTPTSGFFVDAFFNSKHPYGFSMPTTKIKEKLEALKQLYITNKNYEYKVFYYDGTGEKCLLQNRFTRIKHIEKEEDVSPKEVFENYPLHEKWSEWFKSSKLTSYDLFLLYFSYGSYNYYNVEDYKKLKKFFPKTCANIGELLPTIKIPEVFKEESDLGYRNNPLPKIIEILSEFYSYKYQKEFFLNAYEYLVSFIDKEELSKDESIKRKWGYYTDFSVFNIDNVLKIKHKVRVFSKKYTNDEFVIYWQNTMQLYKGCSAKEKENLRPHFYEYLRAFTLKLCTKDELMHRIMQKDTIDLFTQVYNSPSNWEYPILKEVVDAHPFVLLLIEQAINRILEVELRRGDSSTSVTHLASSIYKVEGIDYLIQILNGLGKDTLNRGYFSGYGGSDYSKKEILSGLLKRCHPSKKDTQDDFNKKIKEAKFTEKRLVEVALYAQQWLPFIENYLQWKGLSAAVWWLHAHTNSFYRNAETETQFARYSKIENKDFEDGAVDVDWFKDAYKNIGKARWKILYNGAKYISNGTGHSRAKLYADVITGEIKIREVTKRVKEKRNQDYLRVFGLVPLSKKTPEKDVLNRYNYLLQFKKESKQFGSQRQASEKLAVKIAMDNLARTAGYPDPIRLTWAMETEEAKTILQKAEMLTFNDVSIQLKVDELGKAHIEVQRDDKKLKSIPAKLKKEKAVVELKELHKRLKNQYSRSRKSLEEAMVRGDVFQAKEIQTLKEHPVIAPMLQSLVLISENGLGFYKDEKLNTPDGKTYELGEKIRIAHCTDLYKSKEWATYQRYCFDNKTIQPFKQVFRELYIPTPDELQEETISRRYAGHQVQPKKTVALLKTRGWTVDYEEGLQKVFHNEGIIAKMYAMADWFSPADVESPTLETIEFLDRKTYKRIAFKKINPLLFSEVMRDIDLVVSVAHVGGVDPEASQSTIEMRSVIITETARLFKLSNVTLKGSHTFIKGTRGDYNIHLGSGVTHFNGKYISVLPVHSQHRGRIFLPFVDEDSRSAEIMAKILLFAKDNEIKDPTILEQL